MLHTGLDLSRNRLDVCLLSEHCEVLAQFAAPSDADGLRGLARRVGGYGLPAAERRVERLTRKADEARHAQRPFVDQREQREQVWSDERLLAIRA